MVKAFSVTVGTVVLAGILGIATASAWTARGTVTTNGTRPAPCQLMEMFPEEDCGGTFDDTTRTDANGYYSFDAQLGSGDTVWIELNFDTTSTCQWCTGWLYCVPDTFCQRATSDDPGPCNFNMNQEDCICP